jgi:hypothetical protein
MERPLRARRTTATDVVRIAVATPRSVAEHLSFVDQPASNLGSLAATGSMPSGLAISMPLMETRSVTRRSSEDRYQQTRQFPPRDRSVALERVKQRVRERNPHAIVVGAIGAQIDPMLLYDVAGSHDESGQLSLRELFVDTMTNVPAHGHNHVHADSVTVTSNGCIDPSALVDLLEEPPAGVYRLKGAVAVQYRASVRTYVVHLVGTSIHIASTPRSVPTNCLVAIGIDLDTNEVRVRLDAALRPRAGPAPAANVRRLQWYRRLSI